MRARARATFKEDAAAVVYLEVLTREPLEARDIGGRGPVSPQEYLANAVSITYVGPGAEGLIFAQLRVSSGSERLVRRYLDLSRGSEERRLLEKLAGQAESRIVWPNEGARFACFPPEREGPVLREALRLAQDVDRAAWREATADLEWRLSSSYRGGPRPTRRKRRVASAPADPVPYFAPRAGAIPRARAPHVAGIELPAGGRVPSTASAYWATDEGVVEAPSLSAALADAFHETGLWPLLWLAPDDPEGYMSGGEADIDQVDAIDPAEVLQAAWRSRPAIPEATAPYGADFPGLAEPSARSARSEPANPFTAPELQQSGYPWQGPARLLLVPCNRPADAVTAVGFTDSVWGPESISAVLRSWEERLGAVLVAMGPAMLTVVVDAPPATAHDSLHAAAELHALAPEGDSGRPGALRSLAARIGSHDRDEPTPPESAPQVWELGFIE